MNKNILIALLLIIVLVFAGYSVYQNKQVQEAGLKVTPTPTTVPTPTPTMQAMQTGQAVTVALVQENNSGETGTVLLTDLNGKVDVMLILAGQTGNVPQPAHIHSGGCPGVGPVKYPLSSVVNGTSHTILTVSLSDLLKQVPLAINVHKSDKEISTYTSCGQIVAPSPTTLLTPASPVTTNSVVTITPAITASPTSTGY